MGLQAVRKGKGVEREIEFRCVASEQEGFGPLFFFRILLIVVHILLLSPLKRIRG